MSQCANPLFTQWIKEKLDKAREHNTQGVNAYHKAYIAMRDSPLTYEHPLEAKILQGIGDKLVKYLQDKLKKHCEENGLLAPKTPKGKKRKPAADADDGEETPSPSKKAKKVTAYVPKLRTGPYAIILALSTLDEDDNAGLTKQQIISEGEQYTDSSFTAPMQANSFYTAWNSMKTLTNKNLVYEKKGGTKKYLLTPEGWECARSIKAASDPSQGRLDTFVEKDRGLLTKNKSRTDSGIGFLDVDSPPPSPFRQSESPRKKSVDDIVPLGTTSSLPIFEPIEIPAGSFTVRLVLDNREVRAKQDRDFIQKALYDQGVEPIVRALSLGDTLWVAKLTDPDILTRLGAEGDEILLDFIVERKRADDLVASIKDARFLEQKFRLRRSGVKNVIYVIEDFKMHDNNYAQHMQSAIASSQIVDGFTVKKTQTIHDTIKYLARMTKYIKGMYESKPLYVIPTRVITSRNYLPLLQHLRTTRPEREVHITSTAFASLSSKSDQLTLRDLYIKMLMCMKGVSGEKALEIQKIWKTPAAFAAAFEGCGEGEQGKKGKMELVSSKMGGLVGRKKIAKALSVKISEVWGDVNFVEGDDD